MLAIKAGNVLRTRSPQNEIVAIAQVDDEFPRDIRIYDLPEFLSTYSLFVEPEIDFAEDHLKITAGNSSVKYKYSSDKVVKQMSEKVPQLPTTLYSFVLEKSDIEKIMKTAAVMKLKELVVNSNGLKVCNIDTTGNECLIQLPNLEAFDGATKSLVIDIDVLKLISNDYDVEITEIAAKFTATDDSIVYYVALQSV